MRTLTLCCLLLFSSFSLLAQLSPFQPYQPLVKEADQFERLIHPTIADYFQLDSPAAFAKALLKAPKQVAATGDNEVLLTLPGPDGALATFRIFRYQMITDELQRMYPGFVTLEGWDVDVPQRRVSLNWTSQGFSASVVGGREGRWYVEPLYRGRTDLYQSFFTANVPNSAEGHGCDFQPDQEVLEELAQFSAEPKRVGNCQLQEYDLALACTANYFNQIAGITTDDTPTAANQADVIAEMMTAINRVNQVFKLDLAIQLNIINLPTVNDGVQLVFGGDTLADPYSDFSGLALLGENQTTTDNVIGTSNYDIGHVFSTGGGGVATLGSPCNNSVKARGVTGLPNPVGDPFYIDYVAHEIGHQFGGTHTFNSTEVNCSQRSANTAYEPGGGTTIQAYAGICGPIANIQLNSDPYYHAASIQQISAYMELGGGASCADITSTANTEPTVVAEGSAYSIPTNTPFVLDAVGMDGDGDALTYCWEQFDLGSIVAGMPTGFETGSPLFRSLPPTTASERYFPNLPAVVAGGGAPWEVLPRVARDMTFIVTVRDIGAPGGYGCTVQDQVDITVVNTGEQYKVTAPDGGEAWVSGATETVTWDVAGTDDAAGINCSTVEILLSLDGGATFATSLGTFPNNGSATVTAPMATETDARIMVRCDGNIFYDVSDADFSIEDTDFSLTGVSTSGSTCSGGDPLTGYQIEVEALQGYLGTINLTATGLPAGVTATITPATVSFTAGGSVSQLVDISLSGVSSLAEGTYNFEISGEDGGAPKTVPMSLEVEGDFGITQPTDGQVIPDDGSGNSNVPLAFDPVPGASSYTVVLPGGSTIALGNTTNTTLLFGMQPDGLLVTFFVRTNTGLESCPISVILGETVASGTSLSSSDTEVSTCETRETEGNYVVTFTDGDLTGPADLTVTTVIPGLTVNLTSTTLSDGQSTLITLDGEENLAPGNYTITIEADDGTATETIDLSLLIQEDGVDITSPVHEGELVINPDGSGVIPLRFSGVPGASSYMAIVTFPTGGTGIVGVSPPGIDLTLGGPINDGDEFSIAVEADNGAISCNYDFTFVTALPVQWLSFTAEALDKSAELNWQVLQDESHAGFVIERRSDGQPEWQSIGYLERTNEDREANYRYTDLSVREGNTYYYRLRQEDEDGNYAYSIIRTVTFTYGGAEVFVFPNPTTGLIDIRAGEDAPEELNYRLFSPVGQIIRDGKLLGNPARVNLKGLPAGVYQLVVTDQQDYLRTVRVVKR
ncbi:zinc-dependent metalloprotease family protein [Neolewinella agarilytica]|uniref:zinc-dependent metalloprotease family protein n=1 Tax=Neolewinella agarilytica TaxID=478744 RepID=UPI002355F5BC|nr:zinc-dependent metalloprotease family protein [Neolewinella agarilytica]